MNAGPYTAPKAHMSLLLSDRLRIARRWAVLATLGGSVLAFGWAGAHLELAALERVWEWGWDRGRVTRWYEHADYMLASSLGGAVPVTTKDVVQLVQGLCADVGRGLPPLVALRHIPTEAAEVTVLTRREQWLCGVTPGRLAGGQRRCPRWDSQRWGC